MLRYGFEIYQQLIKMFVRTNKRFPNEKETKFLQNQALRVRESLLDKNVNLEELSADEAIKLFSQPPRRRKRPTAEIYKPLEFGKKSKPKGGLEALDEAKVFDQFRDENTLTNLYRTQEQALADGDIDTSRKIQKQIDALINKEPLSDFADGGRVGFEAGGTTNLGSAKDFIESTGDDELMDLYIDFLVTGDDTAMLEALSRKGYKTYAKGGVVGGKKDEEEEIEDDDPGMFDDLFDRMFGEYELEKLKKSGRKPNADGGRVEMMAGGLPKIKQMIDFILKNGDKVSKVGGKISREFLEFMAEKNPQNIKNVYLDVVKRLGMGIDVGKAPKTNLKKVRSRVEADKRITKELADEGQIEVNEDTASDMAEFMKREDPEGFKKIQKIVDDINQKKTAPSPTSAEKLYDEYIYYRDELGNFKGSFDDFIVARRKAGSLYAEETPLSKEAVKRKQNADGGLATLFEERG